MPRSSQNRTALHILNTPAERRNIVKMKSEYGFEESDINLFFWYVGYRLCLDEFLGRDNVSLSEAEARKFVARHKTHH
jgi:hypothetical protein